MKIAVMPGDGVGKEVVPEGLKVLRTVSEKFGFKYTTTDYPHGGEHYLKTKETLPPGVVKAEEGLLYEETSFHQYIGVVERPDGRRLLRLNEGVAVHSVWRPDTVLTDRNREPIGKFERVELALPLVLKLHELDKADEAAKLTKHLTTLSAQEKS